MSAHSKNHPVSPSAEVVEQAAEWLVRLSADDLDSAARAALQAEFDCWQQQNAAHASAVRTMQTMIRQTKQAADMTDVRHARAAIDASFGRTRTRSRNPAKTLVWMLCLFLPLWLALEIYPPAYLLADARTATGEWQPRMLTDGSHITLGSDSAVNFTLDPDQRRLELVSGEILVEVAADTRPFQVVTPHGYIRALGTRFIVRLGEQATTLTMLESRTAIRAAAQRVGTDEVIVSAGQRVRFSAAGINETDAIDTLVVADDWRLRQLMVENRPLSEVLDVLARHHRGMIYFDRNELARMNVSAVLPLEDTNRALQLLADGFPIRINRITPWLIVVEAH